MFFDCKVDCFSLGMVLDQTNNTVVKTPTFAIIFFIVISIFSGGFGNR